jgi:hypothetical protein
MVHSSPYQFAAAHCEVAGIGIRECAIDEQTTVQLTLRDSKGALVDPRAIDEVHDVRVLLECVETGPHALAACCQLSASADATTSIGGVAPLSSSQSIASNISSAMSDDGSAGFMSARSSSSVFNFEDVSSALNTSRSTLGGLLSATNASSSSSSSSSAKTVTLLSPTASMSSSLAAVAHATAAVPLAPKVQTPRVSSLSTSSAFTGELTASALSMLVGSPLSGSFEVLKVSQSSTHQIEVRYMVQREGRYQLRIFVQGSEIAGSPFSIEARKYQPVQPVLPHSQFTFLYF